MDTLVKNIPGYKEDKIYSQSGQDAFVISYFNSKKNGVFIDIGANNGIAFSNTYYLEKELGWTGICFEPIPPSFFQLEKNRNCIKINAGVAEKESIERFNYIESSAYTLSGMIKEYDPRHVERVKKQAEASNSKIIEIELPCVVLNTVLEKYKIFKIDYLSIDTEGNELKIIKSIDFDRFDIELITIENNYRNEEQTKFLVSKGFNLIGRLGADEVFNKTRP